jgi:hypothetical protein
MKLSGYNKKEVIIMARKKLSPLSVINISIIVISIIVCIIFSVNYLIKKDYLMAVSSIVVIILPFAIYIFERIIKKIIPDDIKLSYLAFVLLSAVLGAIANLYGNLYFYDKIVHFLSGVVIALAFFIGLKFFDENIRYKKWIIILGTTIFNAGVAAFWEICEFYFDMVFNKHVQRGLTDTMTDMIAAIIGCIILSLILINQLTENRGLFKAKKLTNR